MLVLGIDPGTARTGYAVVAKKGSRLEALEYGLINSPGSFPLPQRLLAIHNKILTVVDKHGPGALAVEQLFFHRNAKTFLAVSQARGAVLLTAAMCGLEVFEYTPLQVKQAVVGYGRAEKRQVIEMVKRILRLEDLQGPDDVADALAVSICHLHWSYMGKEG